MKKPIRLFLSVVLLACASVGHADGLRKTDPQLFETLRDSGLLPFFQALQVGAVGQLKKYLAAETYSEYQVLFEQNKGYPQFLRDYYSNVSVEVLDIEEVEGTYVGQVRLYWPNGQSATVEVPLKRNLATAQ